MTKNRMWNYKKQTWSCKKQNLRLQKPDPKSFRFHPSSQQFAPNHCNINKHAFSDNEVIIVIRKRMYAATVDEFIRWSGSIAGSELNRTDRVTASNNFWVVLCVFGFNFSPRQLAKILMNWLTDRSTEWLTEWMTERLIQGMNRLLNDCIDGEIHRKLTEEIKITMGEGVMVGDGCCGGRIFWHGTKEREREERWSGFLEKYFWVLVESGFRCYPWKGLWILFLDKIF